MSFSAITTSQIQQARLYVKATISGILWTHVYVCIYVLCVRLFDCCLYVLLLLLLDVHTSILVDELMEGNLFI